MAVQVLNQKKKKPIDWKRVLFIIAMLAIPILHFIVFFIYVNIDSVVMTFKVYDYESGTVNWGFDNYTRFFKEMFNKSYPGLRTAVFNSVFFGVNDLLLILISLLLSYFFFKKIPGRSFFRIIFFLPSIISIVVYTMAYSFMFTPRTGPINLLIEAFGGTPPIWLGDVWLARLLVASYCLWVGTGYNILIFGGAMANLNTEVLEYAKLDGVGMGRELFQIILPMIWPTLSVAFLGSVTTIFTLFLQVQLVAGGSNPFSPKTIAFLINSSITNPSSRNYAATIGICFTVVATPLILAVRKVIDVVGKKFGY